MAKDEIKSEVSLGLPAGMGNFLITHAPLNSSGDVYHIIAYLILAKAGGLLPRVLLTYDVKTTERQAKRSHDFARTIGFDQVFLEPQEISTNKSYHERVRQSQLTKHLKRNFSNSVYVDQMATTTIVANAFRTNPEATSRILKVGYSHRDLAFFPKAKQAIVDKMVDDELNQIKKKVVLNQPIIVLHLRYSKNANNHLNIPDNFVQRLIIYLQSKGYLVWCFLADDRKRNRPKYNANYLTSPFGYSTLFDAKQGVDYSKNLHLSLLLKMTELSNLKGVIGNTSGTLDLAAFVGHRVYDIHHFSEEISYQDWRLSMQLTFMSVEDFGNAGNTLKGLLEFKEPLDGKKKQELTDLIQGILPNFERWLSKSLEVVPSITYSTLRTKPSSEGYTKMLQVQTFDEGKITRTMLPDAEVLYQLVDAVLRGEHDAVKNLRKS